MKYCWPILYNNLLRKINSNSTIQLQFLATTIVYSVVPGVNCDLNLKLYFTIIRSGIKIKDESHGNKYKIIKC